MTRTPDGAAIAVTVAAVSGPAQTIVAYNAQKRERTREAHQSGGCAAEAS